MPLTEAPIRRIVQGTFWPLLANRIFRIYNVGCLCVADNANLGCGLGGFTIVLQFQDQAGNAIGNPLVLASSQWEEVAVGPQGVGIQADGDPLIAFKSNLLIAQNTQNTAGFTIFAQADLVATDGATNIFLNLSMIFDDIAAS